MTFTGGLVVYIVGAIMTPAIMLFIASAKRITGHDDCSDGEIILLGLFWPIVVLIFLVAFMVKGVLLLLYKYKNRKLSK